MIEKGTVIAINCEDIDGESKEISMVVSAIISCENMPNLYVCVDKEAVVRFIQVIPSGIGYKVLKTIDCIEISQTLKTFKNCTYIID